MRILVVGATGTIGKAVVELLSPTHEVVAASRRHGELRVDIADPDSIRAMYRQAGRVDAVVSAAGSARYAPLATLGDADLALSLANKLMGQVNLVRYGIESVRDGGSFTLTSGTLAQRPAPGSTAVSLVNAGVEAFARAAALELPRGERINVVSPGWVSETLAKMRRDPGEGTPAAEVARAYQRSVEGGETGQVYGVGAEA
ncbi:MAG TPA: short chain dehydrogenase [Gemmatimonadaceae bacterium]|nr:short chain dehydrogenase [Gemmatimonadaceae bacterium]